MDLNQIKIASPCHASWNEMEGDERQRFCQSCKLQVFNISDMTAAQARAFLESRTGRTCIRLYRRQDGTVITKDCPVGLRGVRQRLARQISRTAAVFLTFLFYLFGKGDTTNESVGVLSEDVKAVSETPVMGALPNDTLSAGIKVISPIHEQGSPSIRMGELAVPSIPTHKSKVKGTSL